MVGKGVITGPLIAKYGFRLPSIVGTVVCVCGLVGTAFAPSIGWLYVSYGVVTGDYGFLECIIHDLKAVCPLCALTTYITAIPIMAGFGLGLFGLPPIICIQHYFNKRRPFALGLSLAGHAVGTVIFLPVMQLTIDMMGWRSAALLHAGKRSGKHSCTCSSTIVQLSVRLLLEYL